MNSRYLIPLLLLLFALAYLVFPKHKPLPPPQNIPAPVSRQAVIAPTGDKCSGLFVNRQEPVLTSGGQGLGSLCYNYYKVYYSTHDMTGIIAAERLTSQQIEQAGHMRRTAQFDYHDPTIRRYIKSGYDRGHLTPSADMPDQASQEQTFIWQNIAPELHRLNAGKWEQIEKTMRAQALKYGEIYVLTGVYGNHGQAIHSVLVPDYFYKGYYIPATRESGVYVCTNTPHDQCKEEKLAEFKTMTGITLFPALMQ